MYKKFFENRVKEAWELYESLSPLEHKGEKGMLRELVVRKLLASILPTHFGLGTGVIIDKWERQSSQIDIIIYDKRHLPPIMNENERGIFPIDIVLRAIEVKSILDRNGIQQTFNTAWQLSPENPDGLKMAMSGNLEDGQMNYPMVGCFSYTTKIADVEKVIQEEKIHEVESMFCIADKALYTNNLAELKGSKEEVVRYFASIFLQCIEEESSSRKGFSLIEWLLEG